MNNMTSLTALQDLANGVAGMLSSNIFPAITKGLKESKGVDVTTEELAKWTNVSMSRSLMPAIGFGGAVPAPITSTTTSTTGAKGKAGPKAEVAVKLKQDGTPETSTGKPFVEGKTCRHFFEKGSVNIGKYCGKDVVKGTFYCSNKGHKDKETKQKTNPGVAPSVETIQEKEEQEQEGVLNAVVYDKKRGLARDTVHNFILKQENDGDPVICYGKLYPDNTIRPLTENEKLIAKALDITVPDDDAVVEAIATESKAPSNVPQMPSNVPQMPSNVPQMPSNVPQIPRSVPQIPRSVPQFPGNGPK